MIFSHLRLSDCLGSKSLRHPKSNKGQIQGLKSSSQVVHGILMNKGKPEPCWPLGSLYQKNNIFSFRLHLAMRVSDPCCSQPHPILMVIGFCIVDLSTRILLVVTRTT